MVIIKLFKRTCTKDRSIMITSGEYIFERSTIYPKLSSIIVRSDNLQIMTVHFMSLKHLF